MKKKKHKSSKKGIEHVKIINIYHNSLIISVTKLTPKNLFKN